MKIPDLKDTEGRVFAFEVPNTLLTRREACKHVRSIPGARLLSGQKELRDEEFCLFELQGQRFKAWEPFGDNSRYWIGPEPPNWCEQVSVVRETFAHHSFRWSVLC